MPDRNYTIVFQADTTQALAGMKQLETEFKMLESYINGTGSGIGKMSGQVSDLATRCNVAADSIASVGGQSKTTTGDMIAMGVAIGGIQIAIQAGIGAIGTFGEMANQARDHIKELAIQTMGLREEMKELANLKGADGPDDEILAETIQQGIKAGMMPKEMVKYLEQYEGSIVAGEQRGNIDPRTKETLAVEGAKYGNKVGLAPNTAGDLAGVISQYTDLTKGPKGGALPPEARVEKAVREMARVVEGLNAGRGKIEPLTRSLLNTAGAVVAMGGPIEDLGDLAAIQGVASTHSNPKESGTRLRQAVRALRDTTGPAGDFLAKTAGILDTDSHVDRLGKLRPLIEESEKNGVGGDIFLKRMGFKDDDEVRAVNEEVHDLDLIYKRIDKGKAIKGKEAMAASERFLTQERVGVRRRQKATKTGQEMLIGREAETIELAKENAEQRMRDEGRIGGFGNNAREFAKDLFGIAPHFFGMQSQREFDKQREARESLIQEAERVGIPIDEAKKTLGYIPLQTPIQEFNPKTGELETTDRKSWGLEFDPSGSEAEQRQQFDALATEVERRGGNPYGEGPDLGPKLGHMAKEGRRTNADRKEFARTHPQGPDKGESYGHQMRIDSPDPRLLKQVQDEHIRVEKQLKKILNPANGTAKGGAYANPVQTKRLEDLTKETNDLLRFIATGLTPQPTPKQPQPIAGIPPMRAGPPRNDHDPGRPATRRPAVSTPMMTTSKEISWPSLKGGPRRADADRPR